MNNNFPPNNNYPPNNSYPPNYPVPHPPGYSKAVASMILGIISLLAVLFAIYLLFNPDKLYPNNPYYNEVDREGTLIKMAISLLISIICSVISIVQAVHSKKTGYAGAMPNAGLIFAIISLVLIVIGSIFIAVSIVSIISAAQNAAYFYGK